MADLLNVYSTVCVGGEGLILFYVFGIGWYWSHGDDVCRCVGIGAVVMMSVVVLVLMVLVMV